MPQEPTRPPTSSPHRLATAEERQRVLTAYERGDDWLTVAGTTTCRGLLPTCCERLENQARLLVAAHVQASSSTQKKW
ncbi:hypothetical protein JG687_00018989 [Phytophthora cactorum]|uniref:Uncharacterized protein n=1 Tax=Phytophthora cactorum TaxID=29920 RepID=A0A8T1TJU5_9STRA|nr:hypothetical protein JG687_00018989 [Phytophthora cactorum]